jgi:ribosomal-protein-serine acetyltransferase
MSWAGDEPLSADAREELIRRFDRSWESGAEVVFGAFLGDAAIGGCGLITRAGGSTLEIGYWVHVNRVRQGFATEMARAMTDAAFTVDGVARVEIHHDRANLGSRAVPAGLGFTFEGEQPHEVMAPAEEGVDCTWFVRRVDWVSRRDRRR